MAAQPSRDEQEFCRRIRLQIRSRYPGVEVAVDTPGFALRLRGRGVDARLPLALLHAACRREPERSAALIAEFVQRAERQMSPHGSAGVDLDRLLWCVRSHRYLQSLNRAAELLTREVGGDIVAFVAEALPGSLMRGVPVADLAAAGLEESAARARADANTASRFTALAARIRAAGRIPADGWRVGSDTLFQGSVLLVPEVLSALVQRSGGDVLLAVPDRSVVLALPAALPGAERFPMRVLSAWREAMNPVSRDVLVTDGTSLRRVERHPELPRFEILGWLR
jgi:hypothetical protein